MKSYRFILLIILCIYFFGCVSHKYVLKTDAPDAENTGTVFGRVTLQRFFGLGTYNADATLGRGVLFRNIDTNKRIGVRGANYFILQLPQGTYEVSNLGSPAGPLLPKDEPFRFTVEKGRIKYIGAIVGDRDLRKHLEGSRDTRGQKNAVREHKIYGLMTRVKNAEGELIAHAGEPFIDFYIIDEGQSALSKLIEESPQNREKKIEVDTMH